MSNAYIGSIMITPYPRVVVGWSRCEGQTLAVAQYTALFSLLGYQFGGDGRTNFLLPDLRGRLPMGCGVSPSGASRPVGVALGTDTQTLSVANMVPHTHNPTISTSVPATTTIVPVAGLTAQVTVNTNTASPPNGTSNVPSTSTGLAAPANHTAAGFQFRVYGPPGTTALANVSATVGGSLSGTITTPPLAVSSSSVAGNAGSSTPFALYQPMLALSLQIALTGLYPPKP